MEKGKQSLRYAIAVVVFVLVLMFVIYTKPPVLIGKVIEDFGELNETPTEIEIFSPQEQLYGNNSVPLNISINQMPDSINVYLDDELLSEYNDTDIIDQLSNISEGEHEIRISAIINDTETNDSVLFSVDSKEPEIISQLPNEIWPSIVTFSINYTELNLNEIMLFWKVNESKFHNASLDCSSGTEQSCSIEIDLSDKIVGSVLQYYFSISDSLGRVSQSDTQSLNFSECIQNWIGGEWQECQEGNVQYRDWTDANNCSNNTGKPEMASRTCDYCTSDWECIGWSSCSGGQQTRACTDLNSCNEEETKPSESQTCTETQQTTTTTTTTTTSAVSQEVVQRGATYVLNDEQFKKGVKKNLAVDDRIKFTIGEKEHHYVTLKALNGAEISVDVTSESQSATIKKGEEKKFDVTEDGYYDVSVKYEGVLEGKASVSVKQINEKVPAQVQAPAETEAIEAPREAEESEQTQETQNKTSGRILGATIGTVKKFRYLLIAIISALAAAYVLFFLIRKRILNPEILLFWKK